jgi:4-alpha-glucanotransferase
VGVRHAGVLLHPSSLPGPGPIGELGPYAHAFVDWLARSGLDRWQVLPLHPVGAGHSPYASPSAFAGDWRLVSVEELIREALLPAAEMPWGAETVDMDAVLAWKRPLVREAGAKVSPTPACRAWVETQRGWLDDWTLYAALAEKDGTGWPTWPPEDRVPDPARRSALADLIATEEGVQYLFGRQWAALRAHAHDRGIRIVGDLPLYVSGDGCDVWAARHLFRLDGDGVPDPVAGVPPDYFSPTGQRWGNPTYAWDVHAAEGFAWWVRRLQRELDLVDSVRVDHFRGLVAGWMIPGAEPDARRGRWEPGPGRALFDAIRAGLGQLPLIAEDLGEITPDVAALRTALGLPGMKVLQFAFGDGADHPFLPHNFEGPDFVVYTGTHDNDTVAGWYLRTDDATRHRFRRYTGRDGSDVCWAMLREAWASVAATAIAPMQDVIGVGTHGRMNTPGNPDGNWSWRLRDIPWEHSETLRLLTQTFGRGSAAARD